MVKKGLAVLTMLIMNVVSMADTVTVDVPISVLVVSGLKMEKSGDINFGVIGIQEGVYESNEVEISVIDPAGSSSEVEITMPRSIELNSPNGKSLVVDTVFVDGGETISGDNIKKSINLSSGEGSLDIRVDMPLKGFETLGTYNGVIDITSTII